jgi:hypothetical protein
MPEVRPDGGAGPSPSRSPPQIARPHSAPGELPGGAGDPGGLSCTRRPRNFRSSLEGILFGIAGSGRDRRDGHERQVARTRIVR